MGSPPRMRGKRADVPVQTGAKRITPADAGKTAAVLWVHELSGDHPRGCGENVPYATKTDLKDGITPADAGKTILHGRATKAIQDHPRGCGENFESVIFKAADTGSPPRMRGKRANKENAADRRRITPADAGKTKCWKFLLDDNTDHPRGCGEN